ncbi:MAG: hypothetical protein GX805_03525, partial [Gammaproteobacteria bacterium]|nr:hypothetical protein [Gammaproteobacteria bacterium]
MAGFIFPELHPRRVHARQCNRLLGSTHGRCQVVPTCRHEHAQTRVATHRRRQCQRVVVRRRTLSSPEQPVDPSKLNRVVGTSGIDAKRITEMRSRGCHVEGDVLAHRGIIRDRIVAAGRQRQLEPGIVNAHLLALGTQYFAGERGRIQPQVQFQQPRCRNAGVAREFFGDFDTRFVWQPRACEQRLEVAAVRECPRLPHVRVERSLAAGLAMEPGSRCGAGEQVDRRQLGDSARIIHGLPHQDHAVERDAIHSPGGGRTACKHLRDQGGPHGAIALAKEVLGAVPAVVAPQPLADELDGNFGILLATEDLADVLLAEHAGIAGAWRIDQHHVGDVQRRLAVVDETEWGDGSRADFFFASVRSVVGASGPQQSHVQPARCRAGAA